MPEPITKWFISTLSIAALFTAGAVLGAYLSLEPYQITIFWPPAGVALTAAVILGNRAIPGIALGAVSTIVLAATRDPFISQMTLFSVGSVTIIAWIIQPIITANVLAQQFQMPTAWVSVHAYVRGAVVILLSATIPASAGIAALYFAAKMPISDIYSSWLVWWMGDVVGMVTLTPPLYIAAEYLRGNKNVKRLPPVRTALALCISGIMATLSFIIFYNYDSASIQNNVKKEVEIFALRVEASLSRAEGEVAATRALLASNQTVTHDSFTEYFNELRDLSTSLHCLTWASKSIRDAPEGAGIARGDGKGAVGDIFFVKYIMPAEYSSSVGQPLDARAQAAIDVLLRSSEAEFGSYLHQEEKHGSDAESASLALAKAVYRNMRIQSVPVADREVAGFIVADYLLADLMSHAEEEKVSEIPVYVLSSQITSGPVWASSDAALVSDNYKSSGGFLSSLKASTGILEKEHVTFAGQTLTIVSNGGPEYVLGKRRWAPFFQAVSIMALGMIVVFMLRSQEKNRIERERTIALRDAVVVSAQQPFVHLNDQGLVIEWNQAAERVFGWTEEEMLGAKLSETLIPQRYRKAHEEGMRRYSRLGKGPVLGKPLEIEALCADNTEVPVSLIINSVKYENSWHYFAFVSDISAQKAAQSAVTEAHDNMKRFFEAIPDAIIIYNAEGILIDCNAAATELFGLERGELLGSNFSRILADRSQEKLPKIAEEVSDAKNNRWVSGRDEIYCVDNEGVEFPVEAVISPQETVDGLRYISVVRDTTKQLAAEQRRQQGQMIESLGRMTGILAHDFNNLLSIIIGHLDLVEEQVANDSNTTVERKYIDIALNAALRGSSMVKSLLSVAKQQPLMPSVFDVGVKVEEMLTLLKSTLPEHITTYYEPPLEKLLIKADENALASALTNLSLNAAESMEEKGNVYIAVEKYTKKRASESKFQVPPGDYVIINVTDNGAGMSPETLKNAAAPFFTTKKEGTASGLGLSMVSNFAKQHLGAMLVDSEVNRGTTVSVCIPLHETKDNAKISHHYGRSEKVPRILVVDDQSEMVELMVSWLEFAGYQADRAETPSLALRLISEVEYTFDMLITDVLMPATNGFQLFQSIQKKMPGIKVLYISGTISDNTRAIFGDDEPELLQKPFRKEQMLSTVKRILNSTFRQADLSVTRQTSE